MTAADCDVVVLGGGSGGYAAALRAAQLGMSVTLVEQDKVGGTCLHRGCIPTKALAHIADVVDTIGKAAELGIQAALADFDLATARRHQNAIVDRLHHGLQGLISSRGIEVVSGVGHYAGGTGVVVGSRRITGRGLIIATGAQPRGLPGVELGERILTSDSALTHPVVPDNVVILGGGVIGIEFASIWSHLGATVTIVEALPRLVAGEDEWTSTMITRAMTKRGIAVMTSTVVASAIDTGSTVRITLDNDTQLEAEALLVAVGRRPRTSGIGLTEHGIGLDEQGFVRVDAQLRTDVPGVFAVGDIVSGPQLAHRGFQHGVFVAEQLAGNTTRLVPEAHIPRVAYSTPQVASVGFTEKAARQQFSSVRAAVYDLAGNAKSLILGAAGAVKVISADDTVVGIHLVGDRVGELIGEAQLIVSWGAQPEDVADLIHAHPTQNEALGEAHLALAGRALHAPR
ncbi:dihydrolipoyl dehydrogenase [Mycolicibacterium helvum]|uniref:Dihydrolipoyl dehydrogenase n=1 Tax=Mycolicibacterium helvum TaxID=1534349 RepID=A0A7I7T6S6_9MYCO|nr:dihydrolipoyl dehydrogenase [Mycolicibacterium helvum]BBY64962.1 dihydrolipoyl dehydrogenase [Mycolicibacterium helvum]